MPTLKINVTCSQSAATMVQQYQRPTSAGSADIQNIVQFLQKLNSGLLFQSGGTSPRAVVAIQENETRASGTLTCASTVATNTFAINGVTFTCVASGATGNQFNVGASDTLTAAAAAAAINASVTALISGYVTATSALGVITVTSALYGRGGNQATLVGGSNITASGARLTGGALDPSQKTYTF